MSARIAFFMICLLHPLTAMAQQGRGVVVGIVTDTAGRPIAYTRVAILGTDRNTAAGQDGRYAIADLPVGVYKMLALFIGYRPVARDSVRVAPGDTTRIDFQLRRGPNCDLDCSPVLVPARPPEFQ